MASTECRAQPRSELTPRATVTEPCGRRNRHGAGAALRLRPPHAKTVRLHSRLPRYRGVQRVRCLPLNCPRWLTVPSRRDPPPANSPAVAGLVNARTAVAAAEVFPRTKEAAIFILADALSVNPTSGERGCNPARGGGRNGPAGPRRRRALRRAARRGGKTCAAGGDGLPVPIVCRDRSSRCEAAVLVGLVPTQGHMRAEKLAANTPPRAPP